MISSFKNPKAKTFQFKHRYYDPEKEKIENLKNGKTTLKFKRNYKQCQKTKYSIIQNFIFYNYFIFASVQFYH